MALPEDFDALLRFLAQNPERRAELRALLLNGNDADVSAAVRQLAEAQRLTQGHLARLVDTIERLAGAQQRSEARLEQLAEAQQHTEARIELLAERLEQLAEAQQRTEARLEQLAEAQQRTEARIELLAERLEQLAEAQQRTEARLEQLAKAQQCTEARIEQLAEAQQRTEARLVQLADRLEQLAEAQRGTEARLDQLALRVADLADAVGTLSQHVKTLRDDVGGLKGDALERKYRERAAAFFRPIMRKIRVVTQHELADLVDEGPAGKALSESDRVDVLLADIVIRGVPAGEQAEGYVVVEVSSQVDPSDVVRAVRRAKLLASATGRHSVPAVAGDGLTEEGEEAVRELNVWCVLDGRTNPPRPVQ